MSDSVRPHRWQPTRLPHPWDCPGKNTGVCCHFLLQCIKVKSESEVAQLCPTLGDPMDCSLQALPSMGFSRQDCWSWVPLRFPLSIIIIYISPPTRYIYISPHPFLPFRPLGYHRVAQLPALYSSFPLAMYFTHDCVYMLMLLSQFVPPSLSITVSTSPLCMSASLFLPCK